MARKQDKKEAADSAPPVGGSYINYLEWRLRHEKFASKGDRTRHRLKLAAARVLESDGFQQMRVTDVCQHAEVALGTFYNYFADKTEIATEVLFEFGEGLYVQALSVAKGKSAFEAIRTTNQYFTTIYEQNAGLIRCLIQLDDQVPEFQRVWREARAEWIGRVARSLAKRSGQDAVDEVTCRRVAYALECMVFQFLYDVYVRKIPDVRKIAGSEAEMVELLSALWYRAAYCENPKAEDLKHTPQIVHLAAPAPRLKVVKGA